jgi:hypothetical protein
MRAWLLSLLLASAAFCEPAKPRVVVLTDISNEPDDEESLVRFLVYSNEYDVEALIATTSVWLKSRIRPDLIREGVEAYGQVRDNLALHAEGFPSKDHLLARVKPGSPEFGMRGVGEGKSTEGSRFLVEVVDRPDPRPVWVTVWGGANTLAQALWDVKNSRPQAGVDKFVEKLRVYTISDQDDAGYWIRATFPSLLYIVSPSTVDEKEYHLATWTGISGDRHYKNGPGDHFSLVENDWLDANVRQSHGPLGARYPRWAYIMEGDTPSFLGLIPNGLESSSDPSFGGWGGRYELRRPHGETRPIWTNSRDTVVTADGRSHTSNTATIWRWREAYQNDFAARMDWCVSPRNEANHNPVAVVDGHPGKESILLKVKAGGGLEFSAKGSSDPDGHALAYRWFAYPEAGTCAKAATISSGSGLAAQVRAPETAKPCTSHIILEVADAGSPKLFSYRRVVLQVQP